jgi:peptide deformylase
MPKQHPAHPIDAHAVAPRTTISGTYARAKRRRVLERPDPLLGRRSREIDPRAPGVLALADELITTMRASPACIGLAAPQVGEAVRIFCIDVTGHKKARSCAGLVVMVNPKIVAQTGVITMREGCMSVPDFTGDVARAAEVLVEGFEPGTSKIVRVAANAIEARCLQHEIDHLDGYVFVDRVDDPATSLFPRRSYA